MLLRKILYAAVLPCALWVSGCTVTVMPVISPSEFATNEPPVKKSVILYLPDELRGYTHEYINCWEFRQWNIELGSVVSDAFRYALESRFSDVTVRAGTPDFPLSNCSDNLIVVPEINTVKTKGVIVFKFENHSVLVATETKVHDCQGNILYSSGISRVGIARGSIGYESPGLAAWPKAVSIAVKEIAHFEADKIRSIDLGR